MKKAKWMQKKFVFNQRDLHILRFVWAHKIVTSAAIHATFFRDVSTQPSYRRLCALKSVGYLESITGFTAEHGSVWGLTNKGFKVITENLDSLREKGFKSECIRHDLYVAAALTGPWIWSFPGWAEIMTEQQLRRHNDQFAKEWIPDIDYRRPDGLWRIEKPGQKLTFALEVELSRKTEKEYDKIFTGYRYMDDVVRVLWIVKGKRKVHLIHQQMNDCLGEDAYKHNIVRFEEFEKFNWAAKITHGTEAGRNIAYLLRDPRYRSYNQSYLHPFLETRKRCFKSAPYPIE